MKKLLKKLNFVQKIYRRFLYPQLKQSELDIFIIRKLSFNLAIDVGANVGIYALELAKVSNKVLAFEPVLDTFKILKAVAPSNVRVQKFALGAHNEESNIYIPVTQDGKCYGLASIIPQTKSEAIEEKIIIKIFDENRREFLGEIDGFPDFVKIDVEGFEGNVLKGMSETILLSYPTFLVEVEKRHNANYAGVFQFLYEQAYGSYYTPNGIDLLPCAPENISEFQSINNYKRDALTMRTFSRGEAKCYINNFWFIHQSKIETFSNFVRY